MRNDEQQPQQGAQAPQQYPYPGQPQSQEPPGYYAFDLNKPQNPQNPQGPGSAPGGPPPGYYGPGPNTPPNMYNQSIPASPSVGAPPGQFGGEPQHPSGHLPNQVNAPLSQYPDDAYYPDLTMDMGSSLGYSQSIQYHSISIPQPSQPMPRLRQARLQQLREDRMRRQQRRLSPDATALFRRNEPGQGVLPANRSTFPPAGGAAPGQASSVSVDIPFDVRSPSPQPAGGAVQPGQLRSGPLGQPAASFPGPGPAPASMAAQDTGMIQRVEVAKASSLISGALMLSSILGLLQTFLFTYVFGGLPAGAAYLQAYLIPNLIYTVVAGGALSSAFIPVFTSYAVGRKDEKTAWHVASSALNLSVMIMLAFSIVGFLLAPLLVPLYNPGASPAQLNLIVTLTRIMLVQAIVLGSGVIVGAILNTKKDFTRTALGAVLYNVGLDLGLLPGFFLTFHSRTSAPADAAVYAATFGVVLGALLQVGVQIPGLFKVKMRYNFVFDWRHPGVIQIMRQMVPRIINAIMLSFSTAVDRFLLSFLGAVVATHILSGLINQYFQAFSILLLPVSIFGSSVSTAAFPTLAGYVARKRFDRVRSIITETLRGILFLTIPSAIGLIVLAFPIAQALLEHGNFTLGDAQFTSVALLFFAIGLPALAAVEILTRSFYALQDSKTPVTISVAQFILKIALSIILLSIMVPSGVQWGMGALALSTSIASILEALVLFLLLSNRIEGFDLRSLLSFFGRIALASVVLAAVLFVARMGLDRIIDTTSAKQLFIPGILMAVTKLLIELGIGSLAFLVVARLLHMEEMNSGLVRRVLNLLRIPWL
ncbi:MAG TPA: murein biosynthesis integral membrane protein MurJ [Ktedonobacteraceae bacterium]